MFHLHKKKKDNKGFTLVELVVVIAILAILVGLLVPQYTKYVERSRKSADASNLENMVRAVEITAADATDTIEAGEYTITISNGGTTVKKGANTVTAGDAVDNALKNVLGNDYAKTTLKSKKWVSSGTNEISATIKIGAEGDTSVTYTPAAVKDLVNSYNNTATPAPGGGAGA